MQYWLDVTKRTVLNKVLTNSYAAPNDESGDYYCDFLFLFLFFLYIQQKKKKNL